MSTHSSNDYHSSPRSLFDRLRLRPPSIWLLLLTTLLAAKVAYARSTPTPYLGESLIFACVFWPVTIVIVADYLIRFIGSIASHRFRWKDWRWYVTPIVFGLAIGASKTNWLLSARFMRSLPDFQAAAVAELRRGHPSTQESLEEMRRGNGWPLFESYGKSVGSYHAQSISAFPSEQVVYFMTDGVFRSGWGFLYDPNGRASGIRDIQTRPLAPGWYAFQFDQP